MKANLAIEGHENHSILLQTEKVVEQLAVRTMLYVLYYAKKSEDGDTQSHGLE